MAAIDHYKEGEKHTLQAILRKLGVLLSNHPNMIPRAKMNILMEELKASKSSIDNKKVIQY